MRFLRHMFSVIGIIGTVLLSAQDKGPLDDVLRFDNGDSLHGTLQAIKGDLVTWKRPDVKNQIVTNVKNLQGIKLDGGPFGRGCQASRVKNWMREGPEASPQLPGHLGAIITLSL